MMVKAFWVRENMMVLVMRVGTRGISQVSVSTVKRYESK